MNATTNRHHAFALLGLSLALAAGPLACDAQDDATRGRSISGADDSGSSDDTGGSSGAADSRGDDPGTTGDPGCTLTQGYWKNHSANAKNPAQQSPWPVSEATELCGQTWLEVLATPPKGDAWYILAHQWIAASLNVASGAAPPPEVADALAEAELFLQDCAISKAEHAVALADAQLLDAFNNGEIGPGHCEDGPGDGGTTCGDTHGDTSDSGDDTGTTTADWPIPG